jgi:glycosyltransferase involved in cell wall biosynthesis
VRARSALRPAAAAFTRRWPARSRLFLVGEDAGWVIDKELEAVARLAARIGVRLAPRRLLTASRGQAAFFGSQFTLLREPWHRFEHALGTAYFHGRPGTSGMPEFDVAYEALCAHHSELARVQVTHAEMHDLVLSSGIDPAKVFRIPIGVDLGLFPLQTPALRREARRAIGLPADAFVVGSFQKDGVGWGEGLEPKLIKGPDVLVEALRLLRERRPELHVLLSGPARGYVRAGLERLGIPFVHRRPERYEDVAGLYLALDAYIVPSRQEGGPKSVLESMASGVPIVSTCVGQAAELIRDGGNGRLVEVGDVDALAEALTDDRLPSFVAAGRETATVNCYDAQEALWRSFFEGFVAHA